MSDADPARTAAQSDEALVHQLAEAFDASWQPEDWPRMHELIRRAPAHLVGAVAQELIVIDAQRRLSKGITVPDIHSYLLLIPDLAADPRWQDRLRSALTIHPVPAALAPPPERIGRYPVNSPLAAGGEAQVFLCFHPEWRKQVVVKWMRAEAAIRPDWRERFARQGELLKALEHEYIVRVYDQGEYLDRPFIVTEYLQGRNLKQFANDVRPTPEHAVEIIADVAAALDHAHQSGVCHQDVKPENILVDERGRAKLIDFGVAWFRPAWGGGDDPHGRTAGTLGYFSPEQAAGAEVTARTDIFALGGVLYFLLTGQAPYHDPNPVVSFQHSRDCKWDSTLLERSSVPDRLRQVCRTALSPDPKDRYSSAGALAAASIAAVRRPWHRSRWGLALVAASLVVFAGTLLVGRTLADWLRTPPAIVVTEKPNLTVVVHRPGFDPKPLGEVIPLRTGDRLQARFGVPRGVYASLVSVNGAGELGLIESYAPRDVTFEAIWPAPGTGRELLPPVGTELLFVCGRTDRAPTAAELQVAWDSEPVWPALEPRDKFLRLRPEEITSEGPKGRDFGAMVDFPEGEQVKRRLSQFRERLRGYAVLEGIAFRHE